MSTKLLIEKACGCSVRYCHQTDGTWTIHPHDEESASQTCKSLLESGKIVTAFERWTKMPTLGLVQFVRVLSLKRTRIVILHPAIKPKGQFSPSALPETP